MVQFTSHDNNLTATPQTTALTFFLFKQYFLNSVFAVKRDTRQCCSSHILHESYCCDDQQAWSCCRSHFVNESTIGCVARLLCTHIILVQISSIFLLFSDSFS